MPVSAASPAVSVSGVAANSYFGGQASVTVACHRHRRRGQPSLPWASTSPATASSSSVVGTTSSPVPAIASAPAACLPRAPHRPQAASSSSDDGLSAIAGRRHRVGTVRVFRRLCIRPQPLSSSSDDGLSAIAGRCHRVGAGRVFRGLCIGREPLRPPLMTGSAPSPVSAIASAPAASSVGSTLPADRFVLFGGGPQRAIAGRRQSYRCRPRLPRALHRPQPLRPLRWWAQRLHRSTSIVSAPAEFSEGSASAREPLHPLR